MSIVIRSRENTTFKHLRRLATSARERRKLQRTLLDGAHLISAYWQHGCLPSMLVTAESVADTSEPAALMACLSGVAHIRMSDDLFRELSPVATPSGVLAEIETPRPPAGVPQASCLVLDAVQDAGNVGAALRVAAAVGLGDVILTAGCAQVWSPKVLRAGMGAHFALRLHTEADAPTLLAGYPGNVIATAAGAGDSLYEADLAGPIAWLFGNEGAGLSPALAAAARLSLRIPMAPGIESLNLACAVAVCLFEKCRRDGVAHSSA